MVRERDRLVVRIEAGMVCHWSVVPIWRKVAPCASVPKPLNTRKSLSLPEIKSERIDGANLRGADWPRCGQRPAQHATLVHPCSAIGAYERHCNIFGTIEAGGEGAARRTPRHDQGSPVVSSRSAFPYGHFAMVIAVRSADPGCPSHEDAGSKRHHKPHPDRE